MGLLDFLPNIHKFLFFIPLKIGVILIALSTVGHFAAAIIRVNSKTEPCNMRELDTIAVMFTGVLVAASVFFLCALCFKSRDMVYIYIWIFFSAELYLFLHGSITTLEAIKRQKDCFEYYDFFLYIFYFIMSFYFLATLNSYKNATEPVKPIH